MLAHLIRKARGFLESNWTLKPPRPSYLITGDFKSYRYCGATYGFWCPEGYKLGIMLVLQEEPDEE